MPRHKHDVIDPGHNEHYQPIVDSEKGVSGGNVGPMRNWRIENRTKQTGITIKEEGKGDPVEIMPPYYILVFLMKSFG
jgi:hypothetical protein